MILPAKHLPADRCLSGIGAIIIEQLTQPQSVSETWVSVTRTYGEKHVTFDWFVLALCWLYAVSAVEYQDGLLVRRRAE